MARTKRANGEGSVYLVTTPDGSHWRAALVIEGKRKERRAKTRREALQKLAELKALRDRRTLDGGITLGDWLTRWLEDVVTPELAPRTLDIYRYAIGRIPPTLLARPLGEVSAAHLFALRQELRRSIAIESVNGTLTMLSSAYRSALAVGLVDTNPARQVPRIPIARPRRSPMSAEQGMAILAAMEPTPYHAITALCLILGLRYGEAGGLPWDAVDFDRRRIEIRQQVQQRRKQDRAPADGPWTIRPPKTRGSERVVPMPALVASILAAQWQRTGAAGGLVTLNSRGGPVARNTYGDALARRLAACGLAPVRPHDLRRGCASLLLSLRVPSRTIAEILGHASVDMSIFVYADVSDAALSDAADRLDQAFPAPVCGAVAGTTA